MKDKFIRFLKDNHTFDEYKEATDFSFDYIWNMVQLRHTLLENGVVIFHRNGMSDVDWKELNRKWTAYVNDNNNI